MLRQQTYSHLTESCNSKLLASYIKLETQQFRPKTRFLILGSPARRQDRGHTTLVSCLDESGARDPFRLRSHHGWSDLFESGIAGKMVFGLIISYQSRNQSCLNLGKTAKRVVSLASQLALGGLRSSSRWCRMTSWKGGIPYRSGGGTL